MSGNLVRLSSASEIILQSTSGFCAQFTEHDQYLISILPPHDTRELRAVGEIPHAERPDVEVKAGVGSVVTVVSEILSFARPPDADPP